MNLESPLSAWVRRLTESGGLTADLATRVQESLVRGDLGPEGTCALAQAVLAAGDPKAAGKLVDAVLAADPEAAVAHALRGLLLSLVGQGEQGLAAVQHALSLAPERDDLYETLTADQMGPRGRETGWSLLTGALDRRPCQPACYQRAARAYQRAGEGTRALELLERAVQREGGDTDLREALAQAYLGVGRFEEAIAQCREILWRAPRRLPVLELMGGAYLQAGRLPEAVEALRQQVRLTPMDPTVRFRLGALCHQLGRYWEALTAFSHVCSLAPESDLAAAAEEAVGAIDNFQFQRIAVLASEDQQFRLKVGRNAAEALAEYGFHLSSTAFALVQMLDFDGLVETLRAPVPVTHH